MVALGIPRLLTSSSTYKDHIWLGGIDQRRDYRQVDGKLPVSSPNEEERHGLEQLQTCSAQVAAPRRGTAKPTLEK